MRKREICAAIQSLHFSERRAKLYLRANRTFVALSAFAQCGFAGNRKTGEYLYFLFLLVARDRFHHK